MAVSLASSQPTTPAPGSVIPRTGRARRAIRRQDTGHPTGAHGTNTSDDQQEYRWGGPRSQPSHAGATVPLDAR